MLSNDREVVYPHRVYRHFKGNYFYVLCVGKLCDVRNEEVVVYQTIDKSAQVFTRTFSEWFDDVSDHKDNLTGQISRFEVVTNLDSMMLNTVPTEKLVKELCERGDRPNELANLPEMLGTVLHEDYVAVKVLNEGQEDETLFVEGVFVSLTAMRDKKKRASKFEGKTVRTFKRVYIETE